MLISRSKKCITRIVAIISVLILVAVLFTGCGDADNSNGLYRKVNAITLESKSLAKNSDYELLWDNDANAVLFKSLATGKIWSNIIYNEYLNGSDSVNVNSGLIINVINARSLKTNSVRSYEEIPSNGNIVCKEIENGIRVTYFFDRYKIAIPIDFQLRENSVNVSVDTSRILETGDEFKLLSFSIAPYMCSVSNEVEDAYLFIPTGSGALMYAKNTADGTREYIGEFYGKDGSRQVPENYVDDEPIRLPVFGAVENGTAMMGIVESGAGAAEIQAQTGNSRLGYSCANLYFYVRGYDDFYFMRSGATRESISYGVSKAMSNAVLSVGYYPLFNEDANYVGMANRYREYLIDNKILSKDKVDSSAYSVTFLGGTQVTKSFLGIPYTEIVSLTKFEQVKEFLGQLASADNLDLKVRLLGFGDAGVNAGTIAGGKSYKSIYGDKKSIEALQKYGDDNGIDIFFDSDIVKFSKSGAGIIENFDSSLTAIKKAIKHYQVSPIRVNNEKSEYSIVARDSLGKAADVALDKAEKYNNKAISLSTLGSIAFSDYKDKQYYIKQGIENDATKIIKKFKDNNIKTAVAGGNAYAAAASDVIFDVSTDNGKYFAFDEKVPFYQMVFHGYKNMYTEAINTAVNVKATVADSVAYGMGLGYTLIGDYVPSSDDLDTQDLYGMNIEDNKVLITETVYGSGYDKIYASTANEEITDFEYISKAVSKTTYSNGKIVYVNHTNSKVTCPAGTLAPYSFVME